MSILTFLKNGHFRAKPPAKKGIVDIRLLPRSGAAPWWVSLSIRHGDKSMLLLIESPLRRLAIRPMYKHDAIHKTGST